MGKNNENTVLRWLRILFYINIIVLFLIMFFLIMRHGIKGESLTINDYSMERFGIIITLLFVPLSFKYYHSFLKKAQTTNKFFAKFVRLYLVRFLLIDFAVIFNLVCFDNIRAINFIYLAMIGWISLLFCFPALPTTKLEEELEENIEEERTEEND